MTSDRPKIDENALHAFVDGRLADDERDRVARCLEQDEAAARRALAYRRQNESLHAQYDAVLDEPIPPRLRVAGIARQRRLRLLSSMRQLAAGVVLLLAGAAAGWLAHDAGAPGIDGPAIVEHEASQAHRVFVVERRHPVEVTADENRHLFAWLSNRLGREVTAPPLEAYGFNLIGGRLLPSSAGPAAQFMYEDGDGARLTLYVRRADDSTLAQFRTWADDGLQAVYWAEAGFGYVLIGPVARDPLLRMARSVYETLQP